MKRHTAQNTTLFSLWTVLGQHATWFESSGRTETVPILDLEFRGLALLLKMMDSGHVPIHAEDWKKQASVLQQSFDMYWSALDLANKFGAKGDESNASSTQRLATRIQFNIQRRWRMFAADVASVHPPLLQWSWWRTSNNIEHTEADCVFNSVEPSYIREWARATKGVCTILADSSAWTSVRPKKENSRKADRDQRDNELFLLREAVGTLDAAEQEAKKLGIHCSRSTIDRAWHRVRDDPERMRNLTSLERSISEVEMKREKLSDAGRTGNQRTKLAKERISSRRRT